MLSPQLIKELLIAKRAVRIASKIAIKVQVFYMKYIYKVEKSK